jgi:hypothetical protein
MAPDGAMSAGAHLADCGYFDAWREKGEIGEEGTFPRRPDRFERRREHLQGTAADGDALTNASDPTFADQGQPNGKPAQREVRRPSRVAHVPNFEDAL